MLTGSCTLKSGVGRTDRPLCRDAAGAIVKCTASAGQTLAGWACTSDPLVAEAAEIEATAVCCDDGAGTTLLTFDTFPVFSGDGELIEYPAGIEWTKGVVRNGEVFNNCSGLGSGVVSSPNILYNGDAEVGRMTGTLTTPT